MTRRTKIVATLGPSSEEKSEIRRLVESGLDIARLNFSHGTYPQFKKIVKNVRCVEKEMKRTVLLLQDLQGPKLRLGEIPGGSLEVKKGNTITFCTRLKECGKGEISLPHPVLSSVLKPGHSLLIEDGLIRTKILSVKGDKIRAKIIIGGILKSHKGVNIPSSRLPAAEALNLKDKKDLYFGVKKLRVDAVAVSFVEDAEDVLRVRKEIEKMTRRRVWIIAKIERPRALENLQRILEVSDGLMVARGDLGIEIPAELVPIEQKRILALARTVGKPVIVATQILQSMVENPIATRAEISDAANAIFEHADAFMLSNETAVGKYPDKAVRTLAKVAEAAEAAIFQNAELFPIALSNRPHQQEDETLALSACMVADQVDADALLVLTRHGFTVGAIAKHRPKNRIMVVTDSPDTQRLLHFYWGVHSTFLMKSPLRSEESMLALKKSGHLKEGKRVVSLKLSDKKRSLVLMTV